MTRATKFTISGTHGDDLLDGSSQSSTIQAGGLIINGNAGNDVIKGGTGADILNGGDGNDTIFGDLPDLVGAGGNGKIVWDGGKGSDTLDLSALPFDSGKGAYLSVDTGALGHSYIRTNMDKDEGSLGGVITWDASYADNFKNFENYTFGAGNDYASLSTASVNNVLRGRAGDDYLDAGGGNDVVYGDDGNDIIIGGWGSDVLYGGNGNDVFAMIGSVVGEYTRDTVKDFDVRTDSSDTSYDQMWVWSGYTINWDATSPSVLHGFYMLNGTAIGEITLQGLTYADAPMVEVHSIDPATGLPV